MAMSWMKPAWEEKANRLKRIICSCHPTAPPPTFMAWIEAHRKVNRGEITQEAAFEFMLADLSGAERDLVRDAANKDTLEALPDSEHPFADMRVMWEPISNKKGDPVEVAGWTVSATMYLSNNQPWWLVQATRLGLPTENQEDILDKIVAHLGGDPARDCFTEIPGKADEDPYQAWFTWFNQAPLLDMQVHSNAKNMPREKAMRIVLRGAPERDGYKRLPPLPTFTSRAAISDDNLEAFFDEKHD
jgi:hypothetical protein